MWLCTFVGQGADRDEILEEVYTAEEGILGFKVYRAVEVDYGFGLRFS